MRIRLAGLVNDSIVDGPGLRLAIFTQVCPHHCPECHNPQSHDPEGGEWHDTEVLAALAAENILLDGITLTGGDPFVQPEACADLARRAHNAGLNVWCYTGYVFEELLTGKQEWRALLENVDVLVDGPFLRAQKTLDKRFRGSANQRIIDVPASLKSRTTVLSEYN